MKRHFWWHWQNLVRDEKYKPKGWPHEGRAWFNYGNGECRSVWCLEISWNLWTHFCGVSVGVREEQGLQAHLALPPSSFWISLSPPRGMWPHGRRDREISLSIHDWALWWKVWLDWREWHSKTPRWRDGCFHFDDFFLGKTKYTKQELEKRTVRIPMPEGCYDAVATLERCTWKRPRWFAKVRESIWLNIPKGIPHEGKGENSWDCGKDALHGCGVNGRSYEKAVGHAVEVSLEYRRRYDHDMWAIYPNPEQETRNV